MDPSLDQLKLEYKRFVGHAASLIYSQRCTPELIAEDKAMAAKLMEAGLTEHECCELALSALPKKKRWL